MRAIDTNVVARYLIGDDPTQAEIAQELVSGGAFVPITVLLEVGWLLESRYRFTRAEVGTLLSSLIDLPDVAVDDAPWIQWALDRYARGGDFADLLHLVTSRSAETFATFDRGVGKAAGRRAPVRVETLA